MPKKILGAYVVTPGSDLSDIPPLQNLVERILKKSEGRGNVVMARLSDEALSRIDQLVEATIFGSRSEAAAFLVGVGIESQKELFERLGKHTEEIRKLKEQLRSVAMDALGQKDEKEETKPE